MNKIVAKVKINDSIGLVLEKDPIFSFKRYDNLIIGTDETNTFHRVYTKNLVRGGGSFGGRPFYLELDDGEIIDDKKGLWWDGGYDKAEQILGYALESSPLNDIDSIKDTYIFYGGITANQLKLESLKEKFRGTLYDSKEYQNLVKSKERDELVKDYIEITDDFDEKALYRKVKDAINYVFELENKDASEEIKERLETYNLNNRHEEPLFFEKSMFISNIQHRIKSNNFIYLTNKQINDYLKDISEEEDYIIEVIKSKDYPYITKEKLEILGNDEELVTLSLKL